MDIDFQKRLLATFKIEAKEHLAALSAGLIALEKTADEDKRLDILEAVFREAHSLKGAARAVDITGIESLSHALENVFTKFKGRKILPSPDLFDLLHRAIDVIDRHLLPPGTAGEDSLELRVRELVAGLGRAVKGSPASAQQAARRIDHQESPILESNAATDTVRISVGKLESLFHQAEEMLTAKLAAHQHAMDLRDIDDHLALWEKEWKKICPILRGLRQTQPGRVFSGADADLLDKLLDFIDSTHDVVKSLQGKTNRLAKSATGHRHSLEGMVDSLSCDLKDVLMLPCATILEILPKMVRDLARDRGKAAELAISGETVKMDKRVLDELKDPLIHLVRNCIDHGVEKPEDRTRGGKPAGGLINVAVTPLDSSRIEIRVSDDGAGIDAARVADAAVRAGIAERDDANRVGKELLDFIFRSGISTSPMITDISGRGLGLAIVREKVEKLGGIVTVTSEPLIGTTFRMVLPLTLSTYRGVLVGAGKQTFIVPSTGVEKVLRVDRDVIGTVENRETITLDGEAVSFVRLADLLGLPRKAVYAGDGNMIPVFIIGSGASRIAFGADGIFGEQEILVKNLGPQLSRVRNVAGATVLGNGEVAVILHPGDLVKSAVKGAVAPDRVVNTAAEEKEVAKSVLIAEDSITARTLLRNILETAGYQVRTAVDGIDALTRLRTEHADLVVSDVDMPRMNGFDLTAKIRADRELADLPVVLVTSLDSREDRERGVEAGANAYIVKSSFDQSNLLEVIRRLI
jgi:two-component system chemotaxis sensor kinase CheA